MAESFDDPRRCPMGYSLVLLSYTMLTASSLADIVDVRRSPDFVHGSAGQRIDANPKYPTNALFLSTIGLFAAGPPRTVTLASNMTA